MADSITVNSSNSPYPVPSPAASYDTVTIEPGGVLQFGTATTMTVKTLIKDTTKVQ